LLEGHHQLDQVEAVGVEVGEEAGPFGNGIAVDAEHRDGGVTQLFENLVAIHALFSFRCESQRPMPRPPSTGSTAPVTKAAASEPADPATDETATIRPHRARSMPATARRTAMKAPSRLVRTTLSHWASPMRAMRPSAVTPALATRTSTGPHVFSITAKAAS